MLQSSAIEEALKFIASHPEIALKFLNAELEMPNIPTPTIGSGQRLQSLTGIVCNKTSLHIMPEF